MSPRKRTIILVCIIALGAYFRFLNVNWDNGQGYHPDELLITNASREIEFSKQFDPKIYMYGTAPIYLTRIITQVIQSFTGNPTLSDNLGFITLIGRYISCIASMITILMVYKLAAILFNAETGLLTAFFTATTPLLIQYAHFSVTESTITLFAVLVAYISVRWYDTRKYRYILINGVLLGLAIATKVSTITYGIFPVISLFLASKATKIFPENIRKLTYQLLYVFTTALCVFIITSSITFVYPLSTLSGLEYERGVVSGSNLVFYTYQFIGTLPFIFQLAQFPYTMGFLMTLLTIIGFSVQIYRMVWKRKPEQYIVFLWVILYFGIIGFWHAKFVRYAIPMYPFLFISAAAFVHSCLSRIRNFKLKFLLLGLLICTQLFQAFSFISIYKTPQTRVQAAAWIESQAPLNAQLLTDDAPEFLPETLQEENEDTTSRIVKQIPHFGLESDEEIATLASNLAKSDYYIIGSRRQLGVVSTHQDIFPKTAKFYSKLFAGDLGYSLVAQFSSYPSMKIGGYTFTSPDENAEETVQVFDHPTIRIFQNIQKFDEQSIVDILQQ